jgi:hypothetical protein
MSLTRDQKRVLKILIAINESPNNGLNLGIGDYPTFKQVYAKLDELMDYPYSWMTNSENATALAFLLATEGDL